MHEEADHCCVDQSTDRQCAEEDHRAEPARDQTGDRGGEQRTRKRNQDQPNAGEIGVLAPDFENHENQHRHDSNQQQVRLGEPVAEQKTQDVDRSQIRRLTVAMSPTSRFSAARTDFLIGSR
jgi:hypothetical protein